MMPRETVLRATCLAVVLASLSSWVLIAARPDLWQPFEPDLVEAAREMWVRDEWVIPYLNEALREQGRILVLTRSTFFDSLPAGPRGYFHELLREAEGKHDYVHRGADVTGRTR